jgi:hypothetical protein
MARKGKLKGSPEEEQQRPIRIRRYAYLFLIVCEDQKTEKDYFENFKQAFPERTVYLRTIGTGLDPKGVVERAIEERKSLSVEAEREVDVVWSVFDKDDADQNAAKRQRFEEAFQIAAEQNIKLAFSNEVFELWLLLFLKDVKSDKPLPRKEVYALIQEEIRKSDGFVDFVYKHGDTEILEIVNTIGNEQVAIARATLLLDAHAGKPAIDTNPSTRVHLLIKEIREWITYYNYKLD